MQTINPGGTLLFCKPQEAVKKTASGLFLPGDGEKPKMADVISVGANVKEYKEGNTIVYKPYATTDIKLNGQDFFMIAEEDVLGSVVEV